MLECTPRKGAALTTECPQEVFGKLVTLMEKIPLKRRAVRQHVSVASTTACLVPEAESESPAVSMTLQDKTLRWSHSEKDHYRL